MAPNPPPPTQRCNVVFSSHTITEKCKEQISIFHITENMSLIKQSVTSEFDFYFEVFFLNLNVSILKAAGPANCKNL